MLGRANSCLLPVELSESLSDGEDCELDEPLNIFDRPTCRTGLLPPRHHEALADESASACLILAAIHFERGPPIC